MKIQTITFDQIFHVFPSFMLIEGKAYRAMLAWGYWGLIVLK
jgi:hypothetical protein